MASERRTCKRKGPGCRGKFSRPLGSRRESCETCSPPRKPRAAAGAAVELPAAPRPGAGELEAAVRAELDKAERAGSWRGAAAIRLARECDTATGSQVSSLIKQLEAAMDKALDGYVAEPDFADDVAARRAARMGSA